MNPYVIKKWQVSEIAGVDQNNIEIEGRAGGLLSWLMSKVGISPTVKVEIGAERIRFAEGSLAGNAHRIIPLENISSTYYGYAKPWKEALLIAIVLGIPTFGIGVILAIVYYFLNKSMTVGFVEVSGVVNAIAFKRSVIEGINVDENQAQQVAELTQKLIDARRRTSAGR
jgi:hypothetical protein